MATPVIDRADTPAAGPRRTPAVLAALVAAAAVIAAVVLPGYLLKDQGAGSIVGAGGPDVCWTGDAPTAGDDCGSPTGQKGLVWAFPRLAGHLDECDPINPSGGPYFDDDLPMTFGTPSPGNGAAFRCTLADLGVSGADPGSPVLWVYAFGDDNGRDLRDEVAAYDPEVLTLAGERAGTVAATDVGLVRPDEMFMAVYDDFPFAVIGYANKHDEALDYLAALGMRAPSALTAPGQTSPDLPGFPGTALQGPEGSPTPAPGQPSESLPSNGGAEASMPPPTVSSGD